MSSREHCKDHTAAQPGASSAPDTPPTRFRAELFIRSDSAEKQAGVRCQVPREYPGYA